MPKLKIGIATACFVVSLVLSQIYLSTFEEYVAACNEKYYDDRTAVARSDRADAGWGVPTLDQSYTNSTPDCPENLRPAPCNGFCEDCPEDPDCSDWMDFMMEQEG